MIACTRPERSCHNRCGSTLDLRKGTFAVRAIAIALLIAAATALTACGSSVSVGGTVSDGSEWIDAPQDSSEATKTCVDRAKEQRPDTWTCMGGDLTTSSTGDVPPSDDPGEAD
jgi:hypothetical protein